MNSAFAELFVDESDGVEGVGMVLRSCSVVEYENELVPAVKMTAFSARCLAATLVELADRIEHPAGPQE